MGLYIIVYPFTVNLVTILLWESREFCGAVHYSLSLLTKNLVIILL